VESVTGEDALVRAQLACIDDDAQGEAQDQLLNAAGRAHYQPITMSPFVLCTIAKSSFFSASGTPNLAMVSSKSLQKAAHSCD
jgi:hypothetical protein